MVQIADRIKSLPPYLFAEIDRKKNELKKKGIDIISLGVGDPDLPTPDNIIQALKTASEDVNNHHYPDYDGLLEFRQAVASWYSSRFGVQLDPEVEVVSLIGSKEGIAHIPLAFINPGDIVLAPDPAYPVYKVATLFAGGETYLMPLKKENGFLVDFSAIEEDILRKAKMMFLNYPNNPTAAVADDDFFNEAIRVAKEYDIILCHDAAYTEMTYDGYEAKSFLQFDGAKDVGVEFHSLSKTYCMTGCRIGFAVGSKDVIAALGKVKSNIDSGIFQAVQKAGIEALTGDQSSVTELKSIFQERRDVLYEGLVRAGINVEKPKATFYLWGEVPKGYTSSDFAEHLLLNAGVIVTPGNGFGDNGEGFFRMTFTLKKERIKEAIERIIKIRNW
jgi:LL-diaminopimelate aminotransferase